MKRCETVTENTGAVVREYSFCHVVYLEILS